MDDLDTLSSSDVDASAAAAMSRLERVGWKFRHRMGAIGVYNMNVNDGKTSWFHPDDSHPDPLKRAIRLASMAQARAEASKEKSR
jgi:hypothetical protein